MSSVSSAKASSERKIWSKLFEKSIGECSVLRLSFVLIVHVCIPEYELRNPVSLHLAITRNEGCDSHMTQNSQGLAEFALKLALSGYCSGPYCYLSTSSTEFMEIQEGQWPKTILITGASSGFGRLTAEKLANSGHRVFAGFRSTDGPKKPVADELRGKKIEILRLDVTNQASVDSAVKQLLKTTNNQLDVVDEQCRDGIGGDLGVIYC